MKFKLILLLCLLPFLALGQKKTDKPNILVIWGDDIGWGNISAYNHGMMGYKTPNIDRLAEEGLLTIGMPGSKQGIQDNQATIAELLKPHGYATGQFGKNHLGDQDMHLPTNHGFDEFFGNLPYTPDGMETICGYLCLHKTLLVIS